MLMGCSSCGSSRKSRRGGVGATNDQIAVTQYTGPVGGYACNTAGGYSLVTPKGYMTPQCMTPAQLTQANASYDSAASAPVQNVATQPNTGTIVGTTPGQPANGAGGTDTSTAGVSNAPVLTNSNGDVMIGGVDATQFVENNWMWLAGGVAALLLLKEL